MQNNPGVMEAYLKLRESGKLKDLNLPNEEKKRDLHVVHSMAINNLSKLKKMNSMSHTLSLERDREALDEDRRSCPSFR